MPLSSSVRLGNLLDLVLLSDRPRGLCVVLRAVDDFVRQDLCDRPDRLECVLSGAACDEVDSLVDAAQGGHVDGLLSHDTSGADSRRVLARAGVLNGINENLERV